MKKQFTNPTKGKLKVKCTECNDWGFLVDSTRNNEWVKCPKNCDGKRKPTDEYEDSFTNPTPIEPEKKKSIKSAFDKPIIIPYRSKKEICPKTMSGEHFFYVANLFATNDPLYYAKSNRYPICSYCGIINDLKEDEK